jgi:hypothetical protein
MSILNICQVTQEQFITASMTKYYFYLMICCSVLFSPTFRAHAENEKKVDLGLGLTYGLPHHSVEPTASLHAHLYATGKSRLGWALGVYPVIGSAIRGGTAFMGPLFEHQMERLTLHSAVGYYAGSLTFSNIQPKGQIAFGGPGLLIGGRVGTKWGISTNVLIVQLTNWYTKRAVTGDYGFLLETQPKKGQLLLRPQLLGSFQF